LVRRSGAQTAWPVLRQLGPGIFFGLLGCLEVFTNNALCDGLLKNDGGGMVTQSKLYELFYAGGIGEKQALAKRLFALYGQDLLVDGQTKALLLVLHKRYEQLQQQMQMMAMYRICGECGREYGGGCCSITFAAETDVIQLLMNMLAGVDVGFVRNTDVDCCYLGEQGCIFLFKPMFCLNYLCHRFTHWERRADLALLERRTASLFETQVQMEGHLIKYLRMKNFEPVPPELTGNPN
jgi:hypothetical protein